MTPTNFAHGMEAGIVGIGMGAIIAGEQAKARHRALQNNANTTDAFTKMKNALVYERARNKALLAEIIKLKAQNLSLEEFIEDSL